MVTQKSKPIVSSVNSLGGKYLSSLLMVNMFLIQPLLLSGLDDLL